VKPIIKESDVSIPAPHPNLLPIPFSLSIIARKGSGKTVLVHFLLDIYKGYFDNIFLIAPTANLDFKWIKMIEKLRIPPEHIFEAYKEKQMKGLIKEIENINQGKKNKDKIRTLMIFDDAIDTMPRNKQQCALNTLAFNLRHYAISTIIVSQAFKKIDVNLRINSSGFILYGTDNVAERGKIIEELAGNIGRREFERLWLTTIKEKYSFLFLNMENRKIYKNFDTEIGDLDQEPVYLFDLCDRQKKDKQENGKIENKDEHTI